MATQKTNNQKDIWNIKLLRNKLKINYEIKTITENIYIILYVSINVCSWASFILFHHVD